MNSEITKFKKNYDIAALRCKFNMSDSMSIDFQSLKSNFRTFSLKDIIKYKGLL